MTAVNERTTTRSYLSLGSNLGDRLENLRRGIARLGEFGKITATSSFYETEPLELREQPWFLNCVVEFETQLNPAKLLAAVQMVEAEMGRQRKVAKGPRTLDIDILLFGEVVIEQKDLQIPHPAMTNRRFVLEPLAEIAPAAEHPISGKSAQRLLAELGRDAGQVRRLSS